MDLKKEYHDKELTINVKGKIDTNTSPDFENEILDEMGKFDSLIIDFTDLKYISSAGLRVLIITGKKLKPQNIPFTIKVNDSIREILEISGLSKILDIQ